MTFRIIPTTALTTRVRMELERRQLAPVEHRIPRGPGDAPIVLERPPPVASAVTRLSLLQRLQYYLKLLNRLARAQIAKPDVAGVPATGSPSPPC